MNYIPNTDKTIVFYVAYILITALIIYGLYIIIIKPLRLYIKAKKDYYEAATKDIIDKNRKE